MGEIIGIHRSGLGSPEHEPRDFHVIEDTTPVYVPKPVAPTEMIPRVAQEAVETTWSEPEDESLDLDAPIEVATEKENAKPLSRRKQRKASRKEQLETYRQNTSLARRTGQYGLRLAGVWVATGAIYAGITTVQHEMGLTDLTEYTLSTTDMEHNAKAIVTGPYGAAHETYDHIIEPVVDTGTAAAEGVSNAVSFVKGIF